VDKPVVGGMSRRIHFVSPEGAGENRRNRAGERSSERLGTGPRWPQGRNRQGPAASRDCEQSQPLSVESDGCPPVPSGAFVCPARCGEAAGSCHVRTRVVFGVKFQSATTVVRTRQRGPIRYARISAWCQPHAAKHEPHS
jgi:hypothetical protein